MVRLFSFLCLSAFAALTAVTSAAASFISTVVAVLSWPSAYIEHFRDATPRSIFETRRMGLA
jgi:hypothetical protein